MSREHAPAPLAADGQRRLLHVTDAPLEHLLRGPVIDGQLQADGGDLQGGHHAVAAQVEHGGVVVRQGIAAPGDKGVVDRVAGEVLVVGLGLLPRRRELLLAVRGHGIHVALHGVALGALRDPGAHRRVGKDQRAEKNERNRQGPRDGRVLPHGPRAPHVSRPSAHAPPLRGGAGRTCPARPAPMLCCLRSVTKLRCYSPLGPRTRFAV